MNTDHKQTWIQYTASWKATTESERDALWQATLATDCVYTDPLTQTTGWQELKAYMTAFHQQVPGGHFEVTDFLSHNNRSMAKWVMQDGDNNRIGDGVSYGEYNDQGKLTAMTGFFETPQS